MKIPIRIANKSELPSSPQRNGNVFIKGPHHNDRGDNTRFASVGSIQIAIKEVADPSAYGVKRATRFDWDVGGSPCDSAKLAAVYDIPSVVIAPQATAMAQLCRQRLKDAGIHPIVVDRSDKLPTINMPLGNGIPAAYELFVQRVPPLKVGELTAEAIHALRKAELVVMGPIAETDGEALKLYEFVAANTRVRALFPHRSLIKHDYFPEVARQFDYVQINATEAQWLDPQADDMAKLALRLRWLLEERIEFGIINRRVDGLLWARDEAGFGWHRIRPFALKNVSDRESNDIWGTAYLIARRFFHHNAAIACDWATSTAARSISRRTLATPQAEASESSAEPAL